MVVNSAPVPEGVVYGDNYYCNAHCCYYCHVHHYRRLRHLRYVPLSSSWKIALENPPPPHHHHHHYHYRHRCHPLSICFVVADVVER